MPDFLRSITSEVETLLDERYYSVSSAPFSRESASLKASIARAKGHAVIAEIKPATPTRGRLTRHLNLEEYVEDTEKAGVVGFSVLTQPKYFEGSLGNLAETRRLTKLPILMKDFTIASQQVEAASRLGANAILLIQGIFDSDYSVDDEDALIRQAHASGLEVLTEVNNESELEGAASTETDMIGINHRNLRTLEIDKTLTQRLLNHPAVRGRVTVSESGIDSPEEARRCFRLGVDAILVGSRLMQSEDVQTTARLLVRANE